MVGSLTPLTPADIPSAPSWVTGIRPQRRSWLCRGEVLLAERDPSAHGNFSNETSCSLFDHTVPPVSMGITRGLGTAVGPAKLCCFAHMHQTMVPSAGKPKIAQEVFGYFFAHMHQTMFCHCFSKLVPQLTHRAMTDHPHTAANRDKELHLLTEGH
ncbi:hypothetical protein Anapl_09666 [Anas platyrhynchos]|uniref:Uncharacterized protein n=1 Tax=Anas platyrhynchos TaxID=8839 RepID=R0JF52_ANAPL|nr:hypothetical protein Anapl_09666 [Anas platyrhynchos]